MKKERIYDGITRIREDLIQKAESYEFQKKEKKKFKKEIWMKWIAIAACVCLLMGASTFLFHMGIKIDYGGAKGGGGGGESGTAFMSYAGPVFPLNVLNDTTKIVAERSIDFDFSPYETKMKYYDNFGEETGYSHYDTQSIVTDRYVLTNTTHDEIVLTASYPFVGNFRSGYQKIPSIHVNGKTVETKLYAGKFSGSFYSASGLNTENTDRSNIKSADEWTDFQELLKDGSYLEDAYAEYPELNQNVIVYKLSNIAYDSFDENATNPTLCMEFHTTSLDTRIFSYGSTGGRRDIEKGEFQQSYDVPRENERDYGKDGYLIILGEDITNLKVQGYRDGGCEKGNEMDGVTADVKRYETTLGEVIWEVLISNRDFFDLEEEHRDIASDEILFGSIAELMYDYGILSDDVAERYEWGTLEDMWAETYHMQRVMYVTFEVVVPANGSVQVDVAMKKEASFDYIGEGTDRNGFDCVTQLGSTLEFSKQTASISNSQLIEIVSQNFGFDLKNRITEVELDMKKPHYYMEIRKVYREKGEKE